MSIGDKLRTIDEHAGNVKPENQPGKKVPAQGSQDDTGITNRAPGEEQVNQQRVPRRGKTREKGNA